MEFTTVARVGDLAEGKGRAFDVGGRRVAVFLVDGKYHAIDDVCTHAEASLAEGEVFGGVVECPRHGAGFELATGAVTSLPATMPVTVHRVRVEGDEIQVALAESAAPR